MGGSPFKQQKPMAPPQAAAPWDWRDPDVGWGVVLPDRDDLAAAEKANGVDAPEPIRRLLAARAPAPILRYRAELGIEKLVRYFDDGTSQPPEVGLTKFGTGAGRLPRFLLLAGSPRELPWALQYSLNRRHVVGRLDLVPDALDRYVTALLNDWEGMAPDPSRPVVWSARFDSMTTKMDITIAAQIRAALQGDCEIGDRLVSMTGAAAAHDGLIAALRDNRPAVIVTSSHGQTGPLDDDVAMRAQLGVPVDVDRRVLDVDALLAEWSPGGAIWFAHACCSAGSNERTAYDGLLREGTNAHTVVHAVAGLGATLASLPTRLLGAAKPLRAFVGHVEPTFDWTLIDPETGQHFAMPLVSAVYPGLYQRLPVGYALGDHYTGVGVLYGKLSNARDGVNEAVAGSREKATFYRLTATDRESLVVLGDPTAMIPPLSSQRDAPADG